MIKKLDYLIKLTYDKSYKGYVADVVNLYGCMSQGKTKKEALENAEKAIKAYMEAITKKSKSGCFTFSITELRSGLGIGVVCYFHYFKSRFNSDLLADQCVV